MRCPAGSAAIGHSKIGTVLLAGLVLGLAACRRPPLSLVPGTPALQPEDYERMYRRWTRSAASFSLPTLSDGLRVTATFESWEFRWAYVLRYAADFQLLSAARRRMLHQALRAAQKQHRFLITIAGPVHRESDLSRKRAGWKVLLVDAQGRQTEAVALAKVKHPGAALRAYFPSISPFRHVFRVAFPVRCSDGSRSIAAGAKHVELRFVGAPGGTALRWELRQAP